MDAVFHILYVDDNAFDRQLVRDALERESSMFTVTTAASRHEFEIQLSAGHYDLVVTDFDILGYQGLQVIDHVHSLFPDPPVIVLTGTGSEEVAVEAMKRGAADYVIKNPHHIRRLPLAIQSAIERRRLRDERVRAELKLLQERNLLRTLIDNVPDVIYVSDRNGHFIASNAAHAAAAHTTPSQMIGRTSADVFSPDLARYLHEDDAEVIASNSPVISAERLIAGSSGGRRWVLMTKVPLRNEDEEVVGLVGIARDITLRKQAEEALRKSEEYLQAVIASTPIILFVLDLEGCLTLLDGQGRSVFGEQPDDFIGKPFLTVLRSYIPDIEVHFQLVLAGEETGTIQTIGDHIFDLHYSPLWTKQGELAGMIGVATDITEQLRTERLRIELEKEQEMIAMKERFIATASHDFRSPLAVMRMSVNMLEMYYDRLSLEKRRSTLQQITTQIDRMTRLLDDVLKLSKARASKVEFHPQPIALKSFCEQIWDSYQHSPGNTRLIELVYDCQDDRFFIDPELIHYILANLISNAIKYSSDDGMVRFEVKQADGELVFRISDNGIGIPLQDQANLFEPYHRATNTGGIEGTGLGLSIVKSYVEVHHGRIEFESEEGKGTMFAVYIPIRREPA